LIQENKFLEIPSIIQQVQLIGNIQSESRTDAIN